MNTQWLSRKWQNINQQAKVTMFKYDCSYACGKLGVPFFLVILVTPAIHQILSIIFLTSLNY